MVENKDALPHLYALTKTLSGVSAVLRIEYFDKLNLYPKNHQIKEIGGTMIGGVNFNQNQH